MYDCTGVWWRHGRIALACKNVVSLGKVRRVEGCNRGEKRHKLLFEEPFPLLNSIVGWGHPEVNTVIGPAPR